MSVIAVGVDGSAGSRVALRWAARIEQWCAPLRHRKMAHEMRIETDDVRTAIGQAAAVTDASLLVVGTRGLGVMGVLLGSGASYIARCTRRPIVVVPRSTV